MLKLWEAGQEAQWLKSFQVRSGVRPWYSEIDSYGHVSNVHYCRYLEMGRLQYFKAIGDPDPAKGVFPFPHVLAEQHVRFIERCFYDEHLDVLTKIVDLGRSSATLEQAIIKDDQMRAVSTTVIVHNLNGETLPWSTAQREAIGEFEGFLSSAREF